KVATLCATAKLLEDFFQINKKIFAFHDKNNGIKRILTPKTSEKKQKGRTNGVTRGTAHPYHMGKHTRGKSPRGRDKSPNARERVPKIRDIHNKAPYKYCFFSPFANFALNYP
ncbi:MAG: hypothetical protein IKH63_12650, partial [Prevotella sp.]|nr:hypothetical protein [Prevotella sp.]